MKYRHIKNWRGMGLIIMLASLIFAPIVQAKTIQVGIVYDGNSTQFEAEKKIFINEIQSMSRGAHTVNFPADTALSGGWDVKKINQALDRLMASKTVDMILVLGEVSTHEACRRQNFRKPVFAANVVDAKLQEIPSNKETSGIHNLNYVNTLTDFDRELKFFRRITPFTHITIVVDELIHKAIPQLNGLIRRMANVFTLDIVVVTVKDSVQDLSAKIPQETDAVFLGPMPRLTDDAFGKLADYLITRRLPSFSFNGETDVKKGILAGTLSQDHQLHVARSVAVNILEVLNGTDAGQLPTVFVPGKKLTLNMATARAIHVYPNWDLLTEAELIDEDTNDVTQRLDITMAMNEAMVANLDLAAENRSVEAGMSRVKEARSSLLPQLNLDTQATIVDDDRARAYSGMLPERHWTGTVQATQLIYSDKAWSGYSIEKFSQKSREQGRDALRLDILQAAAGAYLNVLRAQSIEQIQKDNLKLTRENLERARIRVEIGAGGPEEIYRWESQIAVSRRNVLSAQSVTLDTMSRLNRILNRPLTEMFAPAEADFADPLSILPEQRLTNYMDNAMEIEMLRNFLVTEGLNTSPELKQIAASIAAKKRSITLAKREFLVPIVSLFGDATESFSKSGEGSKYPLDRDDTDWSVGIQATLPLFSGGKKSATLNRSQKELAKLYNERDSLANRIEEKILNAVHMVRASYPSIRLSNDAADAAHRNLTLVTDLYARGIKSIIDLIDAQNQALVGNQQAANAVYDFLIDIMTIQRSTGSFFLFAPQEDRDGWMERLERHMNASF